MRRAIAITAAMAALLLTNAGCPKKGGGNATPDASAAAPGSGAPAASAAGAGSAAASASAPARAGDAASYAGSYTLAPAALHIPESKDYAHVKQAKDDPSKFIGAGTLSLTVGADGRVSGEIDSGPASPSEIDGSLVDGEIRGVVRRKAPSDHGLTGTIVAKIAGDHGDGTVSLAEANAAILREGAVSLKRK
jgi:hypothetical protein